MIVLSIIDIRNAEDNMDLCLEEEWVFLEKNERKNKAKKIAS